MDGMMGHFLHLLLDSDEALKERKGSLPRRRNHALCTNGLGGQPHKRFGISKPITHDNNRKQCDMGRGRGRRDRGGRRFMTDDAGFTA